MPWEMSRSRWLNHDRTELARGTLDHWLDLPAVSVLESVWDGLACPITPLGKSFRYSCPECLFTHAPTGEWELLRCKPCERLRCAARTTANLTDAVCLLRRHGMKVRMLTLTLPSRTVLARDADTFRHAAFIEGKAILRKAMRTVDWSDKVTGYLWSYEAPVKWHDCIASLMQPPSKNRACGRPVRVRNRALVPCSVNPHFHILTVGKYWAQSELSDWAEEVGFGPVADIRLIRSTKGVRYSLKKVVTYASKEALYGTATRQTGGVIRQASQLTRFLWRNRSGAGPDAGLQQEEVAQAFATYQHTNEEGYHDTALSVPHHHPTTHS